MVGEIGGNLAVDGLQELVELDRAMTLVQSTDHLAACEIQGGIEAGGPVPFVVMGRPLRSAGASAGSAGCGRAPGSGSSHQRRARNRSLGRVRVQPADVVDLLDELRVGRELELLLAVRLQSERLPGTPDRVLRRPQVRRQRRVDQCVASFGVLSNVVVTIRSTCSSVTVRGRPGRGSSNRPSSRRSAGRLRRRHRRPRDPLSRGNLQVRNAPPPRPTRSATATPTPARSSAGAIHLPTGPFSITPTRSQLGAGMTTLTLTANALNQQDTSRRACSRGRRLRHQRPRSQQLFRSAYSPKRVVARNTQPFEIVRGHRPGILRGGFRLPGDEVDERASGYRYSGRSGVATDRAITHALRRGFRERGHGRQRDTNRSVESGDRRLGGVRSKVDGCNHVAAEVRDVGGLPVRRDGNPGSLNPDGNRRFSRKPAARSISVTESAKNSSHRPSAHPA